MRVFSHAPTKVLAPVLALSLFLGASACGGDDKEEQPTQTTLVNDQRVPVREDGAVTVDGITYLNGEATQTTQIDGTDMHLRWRCIGGRLQTISFISAHSKDHGDYGAGSSTDTIANDPACSNGRIEPGELTRLGN